RAPVSASWPGRGDEGAASFGVRARLGRSSTRGHARGRYWFGEAIQPAIWARELKPSLFRMPRDVTLDGALGYEQAGPICLLLRPSATNRATSSSRLPGSSDATS